MPRVQGLDKTQRRRHVLPSASGSSSCTGGIFSLSTPFANFAGRTTAMMPHSTANTTNNFGAFHQQQRLSLAAHTPKSVVSTNNDNAMEEEEVPGTQNPNFPTTMSNTNTVNGARLPRTTFGWSNHNGHAAVSISTRNPANSNSNIGDDVTKAVSREDGRLSFDSGRTMSNSDDSNRGRGNAASTIAAVNTNATTMEIESTNKNDNVVSTMTASHIHSNAHDTTTTTTTKSDDEELWKYKDGMDDDDSTACNSTQEGEDQSVDLLANDNTTTNATTNNNIDNNNDNAKVAQSSPPISPATQTLDRLSMIGSQDGGAELCVELSVNAVDTPLREGMAAKSFAGNDVVGAKNVAVNDTKLTSREEEVGSNRNTLSSQPMSTSNDKEYNDHQQTNEPLTKEQCIHNLKEYFMSTRNSSEYAREQAERSSNGSNSVGVELPLVTFCRHCTNTNSNINAISSQIPHHSLCTRHEDFFISGSYEILNLIVDGNLIQCPACISHFETGRPNKQLDHIEGCKRCKVSKKGGRVGKKGGNVVGGGVSLTQLSTGATSGDGGRNDTPNEQSSSKEADSRGGKDERQASPELSDYEKLRLRNIQRNEARLAKLGLLNTSKNNKNGFLSRNGSNSNESKKTQSKGKKKQQPDVVQKRILPKRQKEKVVDKENHQRVQVSTNKENASVTNKVQQPARDVPKVCDKTAAASSSKSKESNQKSKESEMLVAGAKSGCRKCTLEWQTGTKNSSISHDACCPRRVSSRLTNTEHSQKPKAFKKPSSRILPSQNVSVTRGKHKVNKVTPRRKPSHHIGTTTNTVDTSSAAIQAGRSMLTENDSILFQYALKKGFSAAFLSGKSEEELLSLLTSERSKQPSLSSLPPFIRDFIAEADNNNEIPAPPGTKWLSCPNPWGKIGHEEGDVVVISPFQSESSSDMMSVFQQGPNGSIPKRFVANPFEETSPYHETHRSPARKGYSVLRVTRDRMGLRPWGFTVRLHEFGGACLVDSIEPLSPAEAAHDISGWTSKDTSSGIQLHDMIICVNGKSVGCMTEAELQIELDLCGSDMMLVVSRFDVEGNTDQDVTLEDLAMDWNDVGAVAPSARRKVVYFEDSESPKKMPAVEPTRQVEPRLINIKFQPNVGTTDHSSHVYYPTNHEKDSESEEGQEEVEEEDDVNDDDYRDEAENPSSLNWSQQLTSELESKSDKELMEILYDIADHGGWQEKSGPAVAKLLAKRGAIAAAEDEAFQRLSVAYGGITKDQVIEWMCKSKTFKRYEKIIRAQWSESTFTNRVGEALKNAGYTKLTHSKWKLPNHIILTQLTSQYVGSDEESNSDEEDSDDRKQGGYIEDAAESELDSKTNEELMEMLREDTSGNISKLATVLMQRACRAAAQDEKIQSYHSSMGGVAKSLIIDWIHSSDIFHELKEMIDRSKFSERYFTKKLTESLSNTGFVLVGAGATARWTLPDDIELRVNSLFESKTNRELMKMLQDEESLGKWNHLSKIVAQRACLAAAQDTNIQRMGEGGSAFKTTEIVKWMKKSKTFKHYKSIVLAKISEHAYRNRIFDALTSTGYVRSGIGQNTRWFLPADIAAQDDVEANESIDNDNDPDTQSLASTSAKRKRESDTFTKNKKPFNTQSDSDEFSQSSEEEGEKEAEDDDNPWLGCVCGRTHPPPIKVFWIQCGCCDAWHNVAEDCVCFSEEDADKLDEWFCWSCKPPCAGMGL